MYLHIKNTFWVGFLGFRTDCTHWARVTNLFFLFSQMIPIRCQDFWCDLTLVWIYGLKAPGRSLDLNARNQQERRWRETLEFKT